MFATILKPFWFTNRMRKCNFGREPENNFLKKVNIAWKLKSF